MTHRYVVVHHIFIFNFMFSHFRFLDKFMTLTFAQVKAGHETWCHAHTRSNARKQAARQVLELEQQSEVIQIDTDFADIDKLFEEKGQGPHLLELDFFPTTAGGETQPSKRAGGQDTTAWIWQHNTMGKLVSRYPTQSGKGWDTGVLSRYLKSLKESKNKTAYDRAQHILALNCKQSLAVLQDLPEPLPVSRKDTVKQWVSAFLGSFFNETFQTNTS
jgi:hypothetical protein